MILWSTQHRKAYDIMLQTGVLRADKNYLLFEGSLIESYRWMASQMKKRIGLPPDGVEFPVWAWYQWDGMRKRPDMRREARASKKGVPLVLLTVDVPDDKVLLSDFLYWHCVLNNGDIIFPLDWDAVYPEDVKRKSWENIFDIECTFDGEEHHSLSTQATMWEIKQEWVQKVEFFHTY